MERNKGISNAFNYFLTVLNVIKLEKEHNVGYHTII